MKKIFKIFILSLLCLSTYGQNISIAKTFSIPISPTIGGTGLTSVTTGDLIYGSATNVWSKLASGASGTYLRFAGAGVAPIVSTLVLPNTATSGRIVLATGTNILGETSAISYVSPFLTLTESANTAIGLTIINNTSGTTASTRFMVQNSSGNMFQLLKLSAAYTTYKTLSANDGCIYNSAGAGNISILNDFATGNINFSAGASSTAHMTLSSGGLLGIGLAPTKGYLEVKAGTTTIAPITLTSGTNKTTASAGDFEYDGANLFFTPSGTNRYKVENGLTGSATLDFGVTVAGTSTDLTITVTGASDGDVVCVGVPNGSTLSNGVFTAWVSASNTVTVRFTNTNLVTDLNPASGTFKVAVSKQ